MFSEKNIVVTIGNYGAAIALHVGNDTKDEFFFETLDEKVKAELNDFFLKNTSSPIYVLLDTTDQSYKKKTYPPVKKSDLVHIVKRDMASDNDKESLKNYIILNNQLSKVGQQPMAGSKWECLFISSSNSEIISEWIKFLLETSNRLVGIYMLPIEAFSLFKLLKKNPKSSVKIKDRKNSLYCFVIQSKAGGVRQIVFSNTNIVFTRIVNYNFGQGDFLEKYEQDIYSSFEYLKRLFPDLKMSDLDVINILPAEILNTIKNLQNIELQLVNYTPFQFASEIGYSKSFSKESAFCDLLISKTFSRERKILKFTTPKISSLEKFFLILKTSYYLNLILLLLLCSIGVYAIFSQSKIRDRVEVAEAEKLSAFQELSIIKATSFSGDSKSLEEKNETDAVERIIDFGKVDEVLGSIGTNFSELYFKLRFLKNFDVKLIRFVYLLSNFDSKSPSITSKYEINISGELSNKSGDIDDLFKAFDAVISEAKKNVSPNQIKYSELPRDMDFGKKYYTIPIDFSITK